MMKRSVRFYRKNEAEVMKALGLVPTKNSGSGWIEKEDGQNENVICQLKSTDAQSIRIIQKDIHTLVHNAEVTHKIPVFAIQFLNTGEVWVLSKPENLQDISKFLKGEKIEKFDLELDIDEDYEEDTNANVRMIKSSLDGRTRFNEENEMKFRKEKRSAK